MKPTEVSQVGDGRRVWIDITDLILWAGHFTGTQRVTFEIALRFRERHEGAAFFAYNPHVRKFFEASLSDILRSAPPDASSSTAGNSPSGVSVGIWGRRLMIRFYRALPGKIRRRAVGARRAAESYQQRLATLASRRRPVSFAPKDVVLILGKPWGTVSFVDALASHQSQTGFRLVHLIHDMVPCVMPQVFRQPLPADYTSYMRKAIALSDRLVAVSHSTERDIRRFCTQYDLIAPPIAVTELGDSFAQIASTVDVAVDFPDLKPGDFLLSVGTVEIRKNHVLLYMAYREAVARGVRMPKLVIVGAEGWLTSDVMYEMQNDPETRELICFRANVSDRQLAWLYANCRFTVYPSVYEGWGLPIAESLAHGKMCVTSRTSSMPEIAGDLIDYFSPYDSGECLERIVEYLDDATLKEREAEIRRSYVSRSWDTTYEDVLHVVAAD